MRYTLERPRVNQYPTEKIIAELRRVASFYGNRYFSRREFDEKATECKGSVVLSRFGSWQAALDATGLNLEKVKKTVPKFLTSSSLKSWAESGSSLGIAHLRMSGRMLRSRIHTQRIKQDSMVGLMPALHSSKMHRARMNG
jgi:hypothetical protein